MNTNLIMVGVGDYWKGFAKPTLAAMESEGLINLLANVDINPRSLSENYPKEHYVRGINQPLSKLLAEKKELNPVVILGHLNHLHTPDAEDLVRNDFPVLIEKPYSVDREQLELLKRLIAENPTKVALAEYYLTMKAAPLLIASGQIKEDSFYFEKEGIIKTHEGLSSFADNPAALKGKLQEIVGKPKYVYCDLLEGEGSTGRVEHRGIDLADLKKGGGMIHDLGIHAFSPLFALEDYIGEIDVDFSEGEVKTALCQEYKKWAEEHCRLSEERIGESYAEISLVTSTGIPVKAALGKYVLKQKNQRRLIIVGDEGQAMLDMSGCSLYLSQGDGPFKKVLEAPKSSNSKYYPVIRSALESLTGNTPFTFDSTAVALKTQEFNLSLVEKASHLRNRPIYKAEASPKEIFA